MADDTSADGGVNIKDSERFAPQDSSIQKAVAVSYEREEDAAPKVVASGRGAIAEQILDLAFAHDIKVREDAELVDILEMVDVDSPIPLEAFTAVAEILAYVYAANRAAGAGAR